MKRGVTADGGRRARFCRRVGLLSAFGTMHTPFHRLVASRLERTICGGQNSKLTALTAAT